MSRPTKQAFPARKVLDFQRSLGLSGPAYACPLCADTFHQEPKLWSHAKEVHINSVEGIGLTGGAEEQARARFKEEANAKAKARTLPDRNVSKSSTTEHAKKDSGDKIPGRPSTAPDHSQSSESKLDEIGNLTLSQERVSGTSNPLKRVADAGSPENPQRRHTSDSLGPGSRRHKGHSGSLSLTKDPEFSRDIGSAVRSDHPHKPTVSTYALFDPTSEKIGTSMNQNITIHGGASSGRLSCNARATFPSVDKRKGGDNIEQPLKSEFGSHEISSSQPELPKRNESPDKPEPDTTMLKQPDTRPISHEQLVVEVKGIYAGLVMVEAKCMDVDEKQSALALEKDPDKRKELKDDQWQSLIALHKQLLNEHHDFFLASQHPSASLNLSRIAAKYSMPARYSMMALLYETVPTFEDTWIECLGDLGRYRMAIEDDEPRDREVWSGVARFWYNKAADKSPTVGRLYHHLAILARPYTLEQLSYYTRSLTCVTPFDSARGSIMTLFNPILNGKDSASHRSSSMETVLIKAHGVLFTEQHLEQFDDTIAQLKGGLIAAYIEKTNAKFKRVGVFAAVSNIAGLFEYGAATPGVSSSVLRIALDDAAPGRDLEPRTIVATAPGSPRSRISSASTLASLTLEICLDFHEDRNVLPLVHVYLVFLWSLVNSSRTFEIIEKEIPWRKLCSFLNALAKEPEPLTSKIQSSNFPLPDQGQGRPLPEDFVMRGQLYTKSYYPQAWFTEAGLDDEERLFELPSMDEARTERILWLGYHLSLTEQWIRYDSNRKSFETTQHLNELLGVAVPETVEKLNIEMDLEAQDATMSDVSIADDASREISLGHSDTSETPPILIPTTTSAKFPPTDVGDEPSTPKATSLEEPDDDVPMMDISPGKERHEARPSRAVKTDKPSSLPSTIIDPESSSPSTPPNKADTFASDSGEVRILREFDDPEDTET